MIFTNKKKRKIQLNTQEGFSLVEFIVVLVIFSIMSSVSIFNYRDYTRSISKTNVAQDIALSIRQAQVYGISGTNTKNRFGDQGFNPESSSSIQNITQDRSIRGVMLDSDTDTLTIFEDLNNNFVYNEGSDRVIDVRRVKVSGVGIVVTDLCNDAPNCANEKDGRIDIVFQRPYPDAYIFFGGDSGVRYNFASILIGDGSEHDKYIEVTSLGNISVKNNYDG